jgi:hypothetical protein
MAGGGTWGRNEAALRAKGTCQQHSVRGREQEWSYQQFSLLRHAAQRSTAAENKAHPVRTLNLTVRAIRAEIQGGT